MHKVIQFACGYTHTHDPATLVFAFSSLGVSEFCVRYAQCRNDNTKNKNTTPSKLSYNLIIILATNRRKKQNQHPYHMNGVLYDAGTTYPYHMDGVLYDAGTTYPYHMNGVLYDAWTT
jgi:hypothetical protein